MSRVVLENRNPIRRCVIKGSILRDSANELRRLSSTGVESVVLWLGDQLDEQTDIVREIFIPEQMTSPLHFDVPLSERLRIIGYLADKRLRLIAQLHTHPGAAFHSVVDDRLALPKHVGGISIVVPDFATTWDGSLSQVSVNIHHGGGRWVELKNDQVAQALQVTS